MTKKIDAVIPLIMSDFERFEILHASLKRFFKDLGTCWVVTRDDEFDKIKSKINDNNYKIIKESSVVPEFKKIRNLKGWFKQQVIKLAITKKIRSKFYLTLDADLICIGPVRYSDLIKNGKALCQIEKTDFHPKWFKNTERILGFKRSGRAYGVTPALLSKDCVIELQKFLSKKESNWKLFLIKNIPWTEYTLYFTFIENTGLLKKYHEKPDVENICSYKKSLWFKEDFEKWNPKKSFGKKKYFFIVTQSNMNIPAKEIWAKVHNYITPRRK